MQIRKLETFIKLFEDETKNPDKKVVKYNSDIIKFVIATLNDIL